jgi:hypothetical protein
MNMPLQPPGPDLPSLFALFPDVGDVPAFETVSASAVPPPYRNLLVHTHHMTVTVEAHHGGPVDVRVLDRVHDGDTYARKILLVLRSTGQVVQFGIVRIRLECCSEAVRKAILAENTPLGRVLIAHDVLRRIELTAFLRVPPGPALDAWFGPDAGGPTYGRLGFIHCDGLPAVELLEIVAPERSPAARG